MASKVINVAMFSLVLFLILGSNTLVVAHGDPAAAAAAGGAAPAAGAAAVPAAGAADATFTDQSGVMDPAAAGLGAGAPAK